MPDLPTCRDITTLKCSPRAFAADDLSASESLRGRDLACRTELRARDHPQASAPSRLLQARACCRRKHCYSFSSCIPLTRPQHLVCSRRGARLKGPSSRDEGKPRPRHCKDAHHRPGTMVPRRGQASPLRSTLAPALQGARSARGSVTGVRAIVPAIRSLALCSVCTTRSPIRARIPVPTLEERIKSARPKSESIIRVY